MSITLFIIACLIWLCLNLPDAIRNKKEANFVRETLKPGAGTKLSDFQKTKTNIFRPSTW